ELRVVVNLGAQPATVALDGPGREILLASADPSIKDTDLFIPAESFAVVQL
ncbi:MAG: hypothetical protein JWQ60_1699, partial [Pseudonocardia sp.]|nr:hypothetical protein [Pseudonocardia sp.]